MEQTFNLLPFTAEVIPYCILLLVLLFISALVSGSEAAFFSLSQNDLEQLRESNKSSDNKILELLHKRDYLLATILITNNLVNIGAVISANTIINLSVSFTSTLLEFLVKTVIVTFLLLIFGEIMPKIMASASPTSYARGVVGILDKLCKVLKPLSYILIVLGSKISNLIACKRNTISIDDLSEAIAITDPENAEDKKILNGIVRFVSTEVSQIMCPRVDTIAIEMEDNFEELKKVILKSGFSRLPVYEEQKDNIKGIIYAKDLIEHLDTKDFKWQTLVRTPYYVPEHKKINDLLEEFQTKHVHLAVVVDEYGSMQGVISLEDILEEIVGEISDESDKKSSFYTKLSNNLYLFDGKAHINDFIKVFDLSDDYFDECRGEAESVAGMLLESKQEFLEKGDTLEIEGFKFSVESIEGRRVEKIKVTRNV